MCRPCVVVVVVVVVDDDVANVVVVVAVVNNKKTYQTSNQTQKKITQPINKLFLDMCSSYPWVHLKKETGRIVMPATCNIGVYSSNSTTR